jgi:hypothetical protein
VGVNDPPPRFEIPTTQSVGEKQLGFGPPPWLLPELPWSLSSSFEVGETSRRGSFEGAVISPLATLCLLAGGISFEGNVKGS